MTNKSGYFIIIRGPLGCGKSTIAEKLADILHEEHINMDMVLDDNDLDQTDPDEGCIPAKNFITANDIVLPEVKEKLQNGQIVIFDACFYHKEVIEHLLQNLPYSHHVFTLKASLILCIERDSKRNQTYGEGAATAVYNLVTKFDYGTVIDISKSLDEAVKEIVSYLPKA
ncbi:MAG: hypothetical protein A2V81_02740 [Candidatus Abawacabacteria bacterium RBG_16_42_10]|uniref:AAA+ ATPase domain-containing protein n=1 Tax=Candidatus Abawacabacteria bacterium RBG_16_42_10 TaxID=1817814 RepID=A0A1F4XKA4_9BACT|nr:MAG: hypothetical protein A2V81_02740 [Candidatus Abawacabacteria bacterium RBG_16_42_10]